MRICNLIGGKHIPAQSGGYLDDIGPATGQTIAQIPDSDAGDVDAAVAAARSAMAGSWGRSAAAERADLCDAIADGIEARSEELAELESLDTGKPVWLARSVDIPRAISNFRFFAGAVRHDATAMHEMVDAINYTQRRPLGVVGLITPWNLPLYLLSWKTAPALATGNAVVAKPSEITPLTADALGQIITEVGAPAGAFNLVHGRGHKVGQSLVEHPNVSGISFTGGTATGARVGATAAASFKKVSLELGGKNSTIVFADCDFDAALPGAVRAAFANQGQVCLCGSRILVERPIYEHFTTAFVERVSQMSVGDPADPDVAMGSLVSAEHRSKVEAYVALAQEEGGTIATGGVRPQLDDPFRGGAFLRPTVVTGLSETCRTSTEEIFGPVVTIHPFDDEADAVRIANGVPYGLAASVWTSNLGRAHRVAGALETGMVWVNTWLKRDLRVPFGGVKASGVGREGGKYSLSFYTQDKNICIQL